MRVFDALRVFPSIILALAVGVGCGGVPAHNVVLVIGLLDAPIFARIVRAEVLALRGGSFMDMRGGGRQSGVAAAVRPPDAQCLARYGGAGDRAGGLGGAHLRHAGLPWGRDPAAHAGMGCHDPAGYGIHGHRAVVDRRVFPAWR